MGTPGDGPKSTCRPSKRVELERGQAAIWQEGESNTCSCTCCTDLHRYSVSVDVGHVCSLCIFSFSAGPFCVLKAVIDFEHEAPDFFVRLLGAVQPSIIITSIALRKTAESFI